jgi:hypothetical protein
MAVLPSLRCRFALLLFKPLLFRLPLLFKVLPELLPA